MIVVSVTHDFPGRNGEITITAFISGKADEVTKKIKRIQKGSGGDPLTVDYDEPSIVLKKYIARTTRNAANNERFRLKRVIEAALRENDHKKR